MTINMSSLSSIYGLLGSTSSTSSNQTTSSTANFEDYLMNALNGNTSTDKTNAISLYDTISNSGSSSLLSGLMSSGSSTDASLNALSGYDVYGALMGNNSSSNNAFSTTGASSDIFSNYLASSFQATMLKNMNAAKAKLQHSYEDYVTKIGDNPSEAAKLRMEQMQQNISVVDEYISGKTTSSSAQNGLVNDSQNSDISSLLSQITGGSQNSDISGLLSQLTGGSQNSDISSILSQLTGGSQNIDFSGLLSQLTGGSNVKSSDETTEQTLMNQLNANSSLNQYLLTK